MRADEPLLRCAAEYLDRLGYPHAPFVLVVSQGDVKHRLAAPAWPERPPPPKTGEGWRMFNDEEQSIVEALRGQGVVKTAELAKQLVVDLSNELRQTLRNLAGRGVVEITNAGVRLLE